jgi:molecular chaperone Hsp33
VSKQTDTLHRFLFDGSNVRGELVHLDSAWQALRARQTYPAPVRRLLGEAAAATTLLASTIKFDGSLILQTQGAGPVGLMVVECSGRGTLRGLARWQGDVESADFAQLVGEGRLVMTIDPGGGAERYQGIVELSGDSLAACLQAYFERSEQLPTRLWLGVDDDRAAGLLVQEMPSQDSGADPDVWNRVTTLADTVTSPELLGLDPHRLLRRLFHEEQVRVFEPEAWRFECRCSRERVASMLKGLGREELDSILRDEGEVGVDCEYCNASYRFDAVDVEQLFSDALSADTPPATRH